MAGEARVRVEMAREDFEVLLSVVQRQAEEYEEFVDDLEDDHVLARAYQSDARRLYRLITDLRTQIGEA